MVSPIELQFNPKSPTIMHLDLNSCFASVEQQANPLLRGKPIAVAAYKSASGCIIAPSVEAKRLGIRVGMRVKEGKLLCKELVVLEPDPWKYRNVHVKLRKLLESYTEDVTPKSIDEFVLNLEGYPSMKLGIQNVAREIKSRIKEEIGDWLTVSVGIAPNRFLAKVAAGLKKPDGLDTIDINNYEHIFSLLQLTDLCGIKNNSVVRLNHFGIFNVMDFYNASAKTLQMAFHSITGYRWYLRMKGWEIDDVEFGRHSYGNSVALGKPLTTNEELAPVLLNLVEKMSRRFRKAGYKARGVHLSILYRDGTHWHKAVSKDTLLFAAADIYKIAFKTLAHSPYKKAVHTIAVSCFNLEKQDYIQTSLLDQLDKKEMLTKALDNITEKWGHFVITPGKMLATKSIVKDRVAFGGVKELEEFIFRTT
jgi:DNA polymerase IV